MQRAADSLLDRAGHLPWIRPSDNSLLPGPQEDYAHVIAGKSVDELLAIAMGTTVDPIRGGTESPDGSRDTYPPDDPSVGLRSDMSTTAGT
jgi:hypothetical protein